MAAADTIALITRYYDAFNRGDSEGMIACVADDVVPVSYTHLTLPTNREV